MSLGREIKSSLQPSATGQRILVERQNEKKDLRQYLGKENDFSDGSTACEDKCSEKQDEPQRLVNPDADREYWKHLAEDKCSEKQDEPQRLVNPDADREYWKHLAEERKLALEAALKENKVIREQIKVSREQIKVSRERIEVLRLENVNLSKKY